MQSLSRLAASPALHFAGPRRTGSRQRRRITPPQAFNETASFQELKSSAEGHYERAKELLPKLQTLQRTASDAEQPAAEAERQWQEAHARLKSCGDEAHRQLASLRTEVAAAAGGEAEATRHLAQSLLTQRLEHFRVQQLATARQWQAFPVQELPLHSIPGGKLLAKVAAAEAANGTKYGVLSLALAGPLLNSNVHGALLHWACGEGPQAGWAQPPPGWHTLPGVSNPSGDHRAWQTPMACCAPVVDGEVVGAGAADVLSVVIQVPLEGLLELRGGIKFVIKRSDGAPPDWVKAGPHNHGDFFVDLQPAIGLFGAQRAAAQAAVLATAAQAEAESAAAAAAEQLELERSSYSDEMETARLMEAEWAGDGYEGGLGDWDWAQIMLAPADEATAQASAISSIQTPEGFAAEEAKAKLKAAEAVAAEAANVQPDAPLPEWLSRVKCWEHLADYPPAGTPTLSQQLAAVQRLAAAVQPQGELSARCAEADDAVQQHDAAELSAKLAQQEKERLQSLHRGAAEQATHLKHEASMALDAARRAVVGLRGRQVEVTQRDLEVLALQQANELAKRLQQHAQEETRGGGIWPFSKPKAEERHMVFVQQKVMHVAGLDANLLVQVYVEGPKAPPQPAASTSSAATTESSSKSGSAPAVVDSAVVASTPAAEDSTVPSREVLAAAAEAAADAGLTAGDKAAPAAPPAAAAAAAPQRKQPGFDSVIVSVAVAEEFPDSRLTGPLMLHFGAVAHQYAGWQPPPGDWVSSTDQGKQTPKGAAQVAFERFTITREDGEPAFVDPTLYALSLRLPLADCQDRGVRGLEFVLMTGDGRWLSWQHGHGTTGNFYTELPLPLNT